MFLSPCLPPTFLRHFLLPLNGHLTIDSPFASFQRQLWDGTQPWGMKKQSRSLQEKVYSDLILNSPFTRFRKIKFGWFWSWDFVQLCNVSLTKLFKIVILALLKRQKSRFVQFQVYQIQQKYGLSNLIKSRIQKKKIWKSKLFRLGALYFVVTNIHKTINIRWQISKR